jgi:hypothetical protein
LSDAVIVAVPAATAATLNVTLDAPAGIRTGVCTVATAGALLVSAILVPLAGAIVVTLTVPTSLPPTWTLVMLKATPATVFAVGDVGEEPHRATETAAITSAASLANRVARALIVMRQLHGIPGICHPAVP